MRYLPTTMPTFVTLELGAVFAAALFESSQPAARILEFMVSPITSVFASVFPGRC
jgi:hypothetical protein